VEDLFVQYTIWLRQKVSSAAERRERERERKIEKKKKNSDMSRRRDYVLVENQEEEEEKEEEEAVRGEVVGAPIADSLVVEEEEIPVAVPIDSDTEDVGDSNTRMAILLNFVRVKISSDNREFKIDLGSSTTAFKETTVRGLREKIATVSSVPPDRQRLIYRGKVLVSDGLTLEDVGLSSGQCIICCPRLQSSTPSSFEVEEATASSSDIEDRTRRIRRILGLHDPDDAFVRETVPYHVTRAANAAKFVAAFLFFYYCITFIFSLALIFKSEEVHEEISNVDDDQGDASLPDWYVVMCTLLRPPQALFGMLVAYGGLRGVNLLSLKLTNRFLCGISVLALFELIISFDVSKRDVDKQNMAVNIMFSVGIFALFWGFCIRAVYRFKKILESHIESRRRPDPIVVSV
jgi:hypothetical protein